jgi:hypothetical protein
MEARAGFGFVDGGQEGEHATVVGREMERLESCEGGALQYAVDGKVERATRRALMHALGEISGDGLRGIVVSQLEENGLAAGALLGAGSDVGSEIVRGEMRGDERLGHE